MIKNRTGIGDLYFIFADNVHEKHLDYRRFKALLNFYALLYKRIVIPDSFFLNNQFLLHFLQTEDGLSYIEKGIIVPSLRSSVESFTDFYADFRENGTFINGDYSSNEIISIVEQINIKKAVRWNGADISRNFTANIHQNFDSILIKPEDKAQWLREVEEAEGQFLTRLQLYQLIKRLNIDYDSKQTLSSYIDINYNFNIPNFLGMSAGYPEYLVRGISTQISPQDVFFQNNFSSASTINRFTRKEFLETSFLNEGILSSLGAEQIAHIKKMRAFKNYSKNLTTFTSNPENELEESIFEYIYDFEKELPVIISKDLMDNYRKGKRKLSIQTAGKNVVAGDGVSGAVSLVLEDAFSMVGGKLIGSMVNIMLSPLSRQTERDLKKINFQGQQKIKQLQNDKLIIDTLKSFSVNGLT